MSSKTSKRMPPGLDPEYIRLRDAREQRRREVESLIGFSRKPARAWSKAASRRAAIERRTKGAGWDP